MRIPATTRPPRPEVAAAFPPGGPAAAVRSRSSQGCKAALIRRMARHRCRALSTVCGVAIHRRLAAIRSAALPANRRDTARDGRSALRSSCWICADFVGRIAGRPLRRAGARWPTARGYRADRARRTARSASRSPDRTLRRRCRGETDRRGPIVPKAWSPAPGSEFARPGAEVP